MIDNRSKRQKKKAKMRVNPVIFLRKTGWYKGKMTKIWAKFEKTKPICRPSAGNPKHETRNPKRVEWGLFEKTKPIYFVLSTAWCVLRKGNWKNKANVNIGKMVLIQW